MQVSNKGKISLGVLALIALAGIGCWIYQQMNGLGITGMSNVDSWGLYIAMFMFFVGLSAGGLIVASSASVFHVKDYKKVALPAVILSTSCIMVAGMFVLIDLGGIARVWRILTGPNFESPLLWDMCVITCYLVINTLDLVWMCGKHADEKKVERLSWVALPVAILVHSVTAWIFGLQIAKAWYSAIMAPIFVASAMDSGLALLLIALVALGAAGVFETPKKLLSSLAGLLATCIAVDAFFIGCEVLTMAYPGAHEAEALSIMATGVTSPFFWFEIIAGLLIPFVILVSAKRRENIKLVVFASVFVVLGVFCKRVWLLFTSFVVPNMFGAPGVSAGTYEAAHATDNIWMVFGSYAPTVPEVVIAAGAISVGAIVFILLAGNLLSSKSAQTQSARAGESMTETRAQITA